VDGHPFLGPQRRAGREGWLDGIDFTHYHQLQLITA
jgi:hypothetical protein